MDETQFSTEEELVNHVKESKEYTKLSKDMPFWSEEKYLMPFDPQDPLLYSFDEEGECEEEELDDSEREKMLEEAKLEQQIANDFRKKLEVRGIDIDDLRNEKNE